MIHPKLERIFSQENPFKAGECLEGYIFSTSDEQRASAEGEDNVELHRQTSRSS
jgi:hypothetical protein